MPELLAEMRCSHILCTLAAAASCVCIGIIYIFTIYVQCMAYLFKVLTESF